MGCALNWGQGCYGSTPVAQRPSRMTAVGNRTHSLSTISYLQVKALPLNHLLIWWSGCLVFLSITEHKPGQESYGWERHFQADLELVLVWFKAWLEPIYLTFGARTKPVSVCQMPNDMIDWIILMNCCVSIQLAQLQCLVSEKREQIDGFQVIKCTSAMALI